MERAGEAYEYASPLAQIFGFLPLVVLVRITRPGTVSFGMKSWSLGRGHVVSRGAGTSSPSGSGQRRFRHGRKRGGPFCKGGGGDGFFKAPSWCVPVCGTEKSR